MPSNWITTNRVMPVSVGPYQMQGMGLQPPYLGNTNSTGSAIGASNIYLYPVLVTEPYRVQRLWWINGPSVQGNTEVAVFSDGGARIATTGAVAQSGVNQIQQVTVDFTLGVGSYWIGLATTGATASYQGRLDVVGKAHTMRDLSMYAMHVTVGAAVPMPSQITIGSNLGYIHPAYGMALRGL